MVLSFNGKKLDLTSPRVMGVLNLTPDSFFDKGNHASIGERLIHVEKMLAEGASVIDLGAVSTRPGAVLIPEAEEAKRLMPSLIAIRKHFPDCFLSIDTFRPSIAIAALDEGADMINDIYGGRFDEGMFEMVARKGVPYVLMHMKGSPGNMQQHPEYQDVMAEIAYFFQQQTQKLRDLGARQILLDPGFGFGKTIGHNVEILRRLGEFESLGYPLVIGVSRKSFIQKTLKIPASEALNGTTVIHTIALLNGAIGLRTHDVKEAVQAVKLVEAVRGT